MENRGPRDGYETTRRGLRAVGPVVLALGGVLLAIGLIDFFSAFGGHGRPTLFWMAFVGLILTGVGVQLTTAGFGREILKFQARQARPAVRDVTSAVREGWDGGGDVTRCPECGEPIKEADRFCDRCGRELAVTRVCACGQHNDADARFCSACGEPLPA